MFLPHLRVKVSIAGSLRDREVACSASDRQGSNFESCVWRTVSSQSSHHPQEVLQAQFSLYVHKGGLKPDSFHFSPFAIPPVTWLCRNVESTSVTLIPACDNVVLYDLRHSVDYTPFTFLTLAAITPTNYTTFDFSVPPQDLQ